MESTAGGAEVGTRVEDAANAPTGVAGSCVCCRALVSWGVDELVRFPCSLPATRAKLDAALGAETLGLASVLDASASTFAAPDAAFPIRALAICAPGVERFAPVGV